METIIIKASAKKAKALKQFLKAFDVPFKTDKKNKDEAEDESPYDPEFVKKILERSESAKAGNTITIDPNDVWGSLGLK